jgi:uncharacterized damage-inducible protein DinB
MSNEANLYLLANIPSAYMKDRYASRTRSVASQFAHMHNVRTRWMQGMAPKLAAGLEAFPKGAEPSKAELQRALRASEKVVASFLDEADATGRVKSWKGSPATFLSYLVAHEAHHRGLAMVAMRMAGRKLPPKVVYGQWDWGKTSSDR